LDTLSKNKVRVKTRLDRCNPALNPLLPRPSSPLAAGFALRSDTFA
jgi:hypothetical protein